MLLISAGLLLASQPALAAGTQGDWPCVQRKVPTLSAGMMWAGPPITEDIADWREDREVASLVERLAVRRTSLEEAADYIDQFAADLGGEEKAERLAVVFSGLLEKSNTERKDILDGIERFTRKQRRLADNVLAKRQELEKILAMENPTEADDEKRRALEEELSWQTRIHEDRERSLTYICEIPVLLEQRLFSLARELANRIE
jgi:hypothetical protein